MDRPTPTSHGSHVRPVDAGGLCLLAFLGTFVLLKYLGTTTSWKLTQWLFSYDLGFVKRGLVGSSTRWIMGGGVVSAELLVWVSLTFAVLFLALLMLLASPLFAVREGPASLWIGVVALLSPGVGGLLADLGRFDVINYALCLAVLLFVRASHSFPYGLFLATSMLMLLIHEASLLVCIPVLLVAHLGTSNRLSALERYREWPDIALRLSPIAVLVVALLLFGGVDLGLSELTHRLATHADFQPSRAAASILLRSLSSDIAQVAGSERMLVFDAGTSRVPLGRIDPLSVATILPVALAQLVFAHVCLRGLNDDRRGPVLRALHLCFFAPFALFLVGVDWGRWVVLASANCAVCLLWFARELPADSEPSWNRRFFLLALAVVVLSAGAGFQMKGAPLGVASSPQAGLLRWIHEVQAHRDQTYRAFVSP